MSGGTPVACEVCSYTNNFSNQYSLVSGFTGSSPLSEEEVLGMTVGEFRAIINEGISAVRSIDWSVVAILLDDPAYADILTPDARSLLEEALATNGENFVSIFQDVLVAYEPYPDSMLVSEVLASLDGSSDNDDNLLPDAQDDFVYLDSGDIISINVLSNDIDAVGAGLEVISVSGALFGNAVLEADGSISYGPSSDFPTFAGVETLTYTVQDGDGNTDSANVHIEVYGFDIPYPEDSNDPADVDKLFLEVQSILDGDEYGWQANFNEDGDFSFKSPEAVFDGDSWEIQNPNGSTKTGNSEEEYRNYVNKGILSAIYQTLETSLNNVDLKWQNLYSRTKDGWEQIKSFFDFGKKNIDVLSDTIDDFDKGRPPQRPREEEIEQNLHELANDQLDLPGLKQYYLWTRHSDRSAGLTSDLSEIPQDDHSTRVMLGSENERLQLGAGNDLAYGFGGNDTLFGEEGNDILVGGFGNDKLLGGEGNDGLYADQGNNLVLGGDGNDFILAFGGNDDLYGGIGKDTIQAGAGNDSVGGGGSNDEIRSGNGNDSVWGGDGRDTVWGGRGDDTIFGDAGNDSIFAGGNDDVVYAGGGSDTVGGGAGDDALWTGAGNDRADGYAGNDTLLGFAGNDDLRGGDEADLLDGGAGNDTLRGGAGADTFVFSEGADLVIGFGPRDFIDLSGVASIVDFADLKANHLSGAVNALIVDGVGNSMQLNGVSSNSLQESDFIF